MNIQVLGIKENGVIKPFKNLRQARLALREISTELSELIVNNKYVIKSTITLEGPEFGVKDI